MNRRILRTGHWIALLVALLGVPGSCYSAPAPSTSNARIQAALQNILNLDRPGQDGFATIWDGNKYIQCGRLSDRSLRCETAGALMQPSLERVLTPQHVADLTALGWRLDPHFGNYVQVFPAGMTTDSVADKILHVLETVYEASAADLQEETTWVRSEPCPPRNGPSQNLAGTVNGAPSMRATRIHSCAYMPRSDLGPSVAATTSGELFDMYGARMTGEIGRLRVNIERRVHVVFEAGIGYVQCEPQTSPPAIYCEAQSPVSWQALASVLTPDRIAKLHAIGYADPGRAPNYWKIYPVEKFDNAAIARELLTILHDAYGYNGLPKLRVKTEDANR